MCNLDPVEAHGGGRSAGEGGRAVGAGEGRGKFLYMAEYGCACRTAPFFSAARYTISPLFLNKNI